MPATYSINIGLLTESTRKMDIFSVLNDIPDNTQKLISPRDVRDAFLSTWANSPFKITTSNNQGSGYEYIGVDSSNPSNRDIKEKILLGKRSFGGLDILSGTLLSSANNSDIFIYNTKPDSDTNQNTKVSFLSGTNSSLFIYAPYIESVVNGDVIDLNIINPSLQGGAINLLSLNGYVSINDITFPTVTDTQNYASNGKILRYYGEYPTGYLKWDDATITLNEIGTPNTPTNIYGSDIYANGYSLEFIEDAHVPVSVGGITTGTNFPIDSYNGQNWPLSEVIRELLYPYTPPILSLTNSVFYSEVGTTSSQIISYQIDTYQRDENDMIVDYQISNTTIHGLTYSGLPGTSIIGTISAPTFSTIPKKINYVLSVSDYIPGFFTYSVTASSEFIYPIFSGFSNTIATDSATLKTVTSELTKHIIPQPNGSDLELTYNGSGYLYLIYSNSFSILNEIRDPNNFLIYEAFEASLSAFTSSIIQHNDYNNSMFYVLRSKNKTSFTSISDITLSDKFKFRF